MIPDEDNIVSETGAAFRTVVGPVVRQFAVTLGVLAIISVGVLVVAGFFIGRLFK